MRAVDDDNDGHGSRSQSENEEEEKYDEITLYGDQHSDDDKPGPQQLWLPMQGVRDQDEPHPLRRFFRKDRDEYPTLLERKELARWAGLMKQDASPNYDQVTSVKWVETEKNRNRVTNSIKNKVYDGVVCLDHRVNKKTGVALPTCLLALPHCLPVHATIWPFVTGEANEDCANLWCNSCDAPIIWRSKQSDRNLVKNGEVAFKPMCAYAFFGNYVHHTKFANGGSQNEKEYPPKSGTFLEGIVEVMRLYRVSKRKKQETRSAKRVATSLTYSARRTILGL